MDTDQVALILKNLRIKAREVDLVLASLEARQKELIKTIEVCERALRGEKKLTTQEVSASVKTPTQPKPLWDRMDECED